VSGTNSAFGFLGTQLSHTPKFDKALDVVFEKFERMSLKKIARLVKRHRRVPGVPMLYDWNLLCFYRGVVINSPNSEYVYLTFRSLRTARVYIKKERRNGSK
jgi:hypothetical protein